MKQIAQQTILQAETMFLLLEAFMFLLHQHAMNQKTHAKTVLLKIHAQKETSPSQLGYLYLTHGTYHTTQFTPLLQASTKR